MQYVSFEVLAVILAMFWLDKPVGHVSSTAERTEWRSGQSGRAAALSQNPTSPHTSYLARASTLIIPLQD